MTDIRKGRLEIRQNVLLVRFQTKKGGMSEPSQILPNNLHPDLQNKRLEELDGREVELELYQGQPRRVRPVGEPWTDSKSTITSQNQASSRTQNENLEDSENKQSISNGEFHNPYNFVPALKRNIADPKLGDRHPIPLGHDCYQDNYWSGKITCSLTTITPLLILDAAKLEEDDKDKEHKTYPLRYVNGKPYIAPTSIKGMLRSAYEAVTNSRFGVFEKHDVRLAYRMSAQKVDVVPARVESRNNKLVLRIMEDIDTIGYAGKLPRYPRKVPGKPTNFTLRYEKTNELPQHGDRVWVRLNPQGENPIKKSIVTRICKRTDNSSPPGQGNWRRGWVYISNENINGKKYERVFLESDDDITYSITPEIKALWRELIQDYQATHEDDLKDRDKDGNTYDRYLGDDPGKTAWSRHIYEPGAENLQEGTLCYVEFDKNDEIKALIPVILSRRLYEETPADLLDSSLHPATNLAELSPADRVFGWVNQQGVGAYKGQLRISYVQYEQCLNGNPISQFTDGLPLTILGQPKPQQARFYIAKNKLGEPLDKKAKESGYQENQAIRGRKVYPHHQGTVARGDWRNPTEDRTQQNNSYQEYRRPKLNGQEKDNQNRSIKAWVNPGTIFQFDIDVINLSAVELGALLWLLDLQKYHAKDHFHRLGGGKPLGFGSVRIQIIETDLRKGEDWQEFYSSLHSQKKPEQAKATDTIAQFKDAVKNSANQPTFEEISYIAAFLKAASGFDDRLPIHYPRVTKTPEPKSENFQWFVDNESADGFKLSLPLLINDQGLPYKPKHNKPKKNR